MAFDIANFIDKLPPLPIPGLHSKDSIGIDIGSSSIKIVQVKGGHGKYQLVRWSLISLSPSEEGEKVELTPEEKRAATITALRTYRGSGKGISKNVVASVSGISVIVRYVKFQKLTRKELSKTIKAEAEPHIPFNIEEVYLSFQPLRDVNEAGKQKMETVLAAAKKDFVNEKIEIFESAGFRPVIMDIDAFALESVYESTQEVLPPNETVLIANIGNSKTNFSIVEKGISVVVKDSPIAGLSITKGITKSMGVDIATAEKLKNTYGLFDTPEEREFALKEGKKEAVDISDSIASFVKDFVVETKKILQYYATQGKDKKVNRALISGGTANIKNLAPQLTKELGMPVEKLNPFAKISGSEGVPEEHQSTLSIAVGLAMRKPGDIEE